MAATLAMWVTPAAAQEDYGPHNEIRVRILGGTTRFSQPMRDVDALRAMANANRSQIARVLTMVGLSDISDKVIEALTAGNVTDATIGTGTHLDWMALKRRGTPDVLRNVRWAGRSSFDAFQLKVDHAGYTYTLVVPKVCGNLSLVSKTAIPVTRTAEATPPPPPPPPPPAPPAREPEPEPAAAPPPPIPVAQAAPVPPSEYGKWIASGFIGVNMTMNVDFVETDDSDPSFTYGGSLAYLWSHKYGIEGILDMGPAPGIDSAGFAIAPGGARNVNALMANFIAALPFGGHRRFQPFGSFGVGKIRFNGDVIDSNGFIADESESRWGWDLGIGTAAFSGRWGVRGDIRYYRARGDDPVDLSTTADVARSLVTGLTFWRANVGLAYRF